MMVLSGTMVLSCAGRNENISHTKNQNDGRGAACAPLPERRERID